MDLFLATIAVLNLVAAIVIFLFVFRIGVKQQEHVECTEHLWGAFSSLYEGIALHHADCLEDMERFDEANEVLIDAGLEPREYPPEHICDHSCSESGSDPWEDEGEQWKNN